MHEYYLTRRLIKFLQKRKRFFIYSIRFECDFLVTYRLSWLTCSIFSDIRVLTTSGPQTAVASLMPTTNTSTAAMRYLETQLLSNGVHDSYGPQFSMDRRISSQAVEIALLRGHQTNPQIVKWAHILKVQYTLLLPVVWKSSILMSSLKVVC